MEKRQGWLLTALCLLLSSLGAANCSKFIYAIVAPRSVRVSQNESIGIQVSRVPVQLVFASTGMDTQHFILTNRSLVIAYRLKEKYANLNLVDFSFIFREPDATGQLSFDRVVLALANFSLSVLSDEPLVFIETSKPVYKPADKVQFRVLSVLSSSLTPVKTDPAFTDVLIESPNRRKMAIWKNVGWVRAFRGFDYQLTRDPDEGQWRIVALSGSKSVNETFQVKKYVLPKFSVTVKPPKSFVYSDSLMKVEVCAKYTTGKAMKGTIVAQACVKKGPVAIPCSASSKSLDGRTMCLPFTFSTDFFKKHRDYRYFYPYDVWITASAKEQGTGETVNQNLNIGRLKYTVCNLKIESQTFFKSGLPIYARVVTTHHDGSIFPGIRISCNVYGLDQWSGNGKVEISDKYGVVELTIFPVPKQSFNLHCRHAISEAAEGSNAAYASFYFTLTNSVSGVFLQINSPILNYPPAANPVRLSRLCSGVLDILLESNKALSSDIVQLQTISRGVVGTVKVFDSVHWKRHASFKTVFTAEIRLHINPRDFIDLHLVAYIVRPDGHVLADQLEIKLLERCLKNINTARTGFQFSKPVAEPGEKISAQLKYIGKEAHCAMKISDVALLNFGTTGNVEVSDFVDKVTKSNHNYVNRENDPHNTLVKLLTSLCGRKIDGLAIYNAREMIDVFNEEGLYIATNGILLNTSSCQRYQRGVRRKHGQFPMEERMLMRMDSATGGGGKQSSKLVNTEPEMTETVRDYFPETWKFEVLENPEHQMPLTSPDSMTTWRASLYCVSEEGFGVAPPSSLTVFTTFYIQVTLPYSIIRGELAEIPVKVFNYLPHCYEVTLTAQTGEGIRLRGHGKITLCVCDYDQTTVHFKVEGIHLGKQDLQVTARTNSSLFCYNKGRSYTGKYHTDAVKRSILVEAEGIPQESTVGDLICLEKSSGQKTVNLAADVPNPVVPDSSRGYAIWTGDIMGPSLANLDSLVRMPFGCGEQNMITLVPSIYILDYFASMGIMMPTLEEKARGFIKVGYRRELNYRHADGSFSAFGESDTFGSTWLTAFVVKSFIQARKYTTVDSSILSSALKFITLLQNSAGCFREKGNVIHHDLKGASDSDVATLTAYVLTAVMEADQTLLPNRGDVIAGAVRCIQKNTPIDLNKLGIGGLALRTYALGLRQVNDTLFRAYFSALEQRIRAEDGLMFWPDDSRATANKVPGWHISGGTSREVEATGYGLLSVMNTWPIVKCLNIVRWLTRKRNAEGGWYSTQDTVVGLHSLAKFARTLTSFNGSSLTVTVTGSKVSFSEKINQTNRLMTWKKPINVPNSLEFNISGKGCIVVLVNTRFNLPQTTQREPAFEISLTTKGNTGVDTQGTIKGCAFYNSTTHSSSSMVVLEMNMLSGWQPTPNSLADLRSRIREGGLKRIDVDKTALLLYFDAFARGQRTCVDVEVERKIRVDNVQSSRARVYDYYQPEYSAEAMYNFASSSSKSVSEGNRLKLKPPSRRCYVSNNLSRLDQLRLLKGLCYGNNRLVFVRKQSNSTMWSVDSIENNQIFSSSASLSMTVPFPCLQTASVDKRYVLIVPELKSYTNSLIVTEKSIVLSVPIARKYLNPKRAALCLYQRALHMAILRYYGEMIATAAPFLGLVNCLYCPMEIPDTIPKDRICGPKIPRVIASNYNAPSEQWYLKESISADVSTKSKIVLVERCLCRLKDISSGFKKEFVIFGRLKRLLVPKDGVLFLDRAYMVTPYASFRKFCGLK